MKKIIDYVISYEDGLYLVMSLYEDRQWDTVMTFKHPMNAIEFMHELLKNLE